ncbi:MAG TPA: hypothetical protein VMZ28_09815 [Kofleriaceae bacterium]|nr:hypothetical protein [Kofleriaceae bacterium]
MRSACVALLLVACGGGREPPAKPLPGEAFSLQWGVSQGLWGQEELTIDGTGQARYHFTSARGKGTVDTARRLAAADLEAIREATASAAFCALRPARDGIPDEGQPTLTVTHGARTCSVTLWDGEWEERPEARPAWDAMNVLIERMKAGTR